MIDIKFIVKIGIVYIYGDKGSVIIGVKIGFVGFIVRCFVD